jgi:hypothetical protein
MTIDAGSIQTLCLEGKLVEIVEGDGRRFATIVVTTPVVLDVTDAGLGDVHLGDRVVVSGQLALGRAKDQPGSGL